MYTNSIKDFSLDSKYLNLSFFGNKLNIGIIGAGRGAFIKAKTFLDKGCNVEVLALNFIEDFEELKRNGIKIIKDKYYKEFINNKHIIVIAIDDNEIIKEIVTDCNNLCKLYINSSSFKEGLGVVPVTRESKNITISVNTKLGNPKAAVFIANKIVDLINKYDDLVEFTSYIRNNIDINKEVKKDLLTFINSDDYEFFYSIGKHIDILKLFYNHKVMEEINTIKQGEDINGTSTCN